MLPGGFEERVPDESEKYDKIDRVHDVRTL